VIANQQQNCSYQDQHSSDAKCHQPQSTTRSGVRFFLQEGGSTIAALLYIWGQVDSSHPFLSSQVLCDRHWRGRGGSLFAMLGQSYFQSDSEGL
jgi:hypothetical protein